MISVSSRVLQFCSGSPGRMAWVERLPQMVAELAERWQLTVGDRIEGEGEASWVAAAVRRDGSPAVLKLGMPHLEAEHEIDGLRFWDGDPTVRLLDADERRGAMLLERCEPGTPLREAPEPEQDVVIAGLLRRMRKAPRAGHPFRPLAVMVEAWIAETRAREAEWPDPGLVRAGIETYRDLLGSGPPPVLLATDLHAGNVLRAQRAPWLVIDPKPFVGDPAYDVTQHLLNGYGRLSADPLGAIERCSQLLDLDAARVRGWLFARLAARAREDATRHRWNDVARAIAP